MVRVSVMKCCHRSPYGVHFQERNSTIDDVLPLRHPITDKNGKVHTEIYIKAGQVRFLTSRLMPIPSSLRFTDGYYPRSFC